MGREPMVGGYTQPPSKSRAGLWAHPQPPGLPALARSLFPGFDGACSWQKTRTVLPPGGLLWQDQSLHTKIPLGGLLTFLPTPPRSDWTRANWFSLPGTSSAQFWASVSLLARTTHCLLESFHQGLVGLDADLDLSPGGLICCP